MKQNPNLLGSDRSLYRFAGGVFGTLMGLILAGVFVGLNIEIKFFIIGTLGIIGRSIGDVLSYAFK